MGTIRLCKVGDKIITDINWTLIARSLTYICVYHLLGYAIRLETLLHHEVET